jgi:hypothetical protein
MTFGRSWRLLVAIGTAALAAAGMLGLTTAPARAGTATGGGAPAGGGLAPVVIAVIGIVIIGPALALLIVALRRQWHRKRVAK